MAVAATSTDVEVRSKDGKRRRITGLEAPGILGSEMYADLYEAIRTGRHPRVDAGDARAVVEVLDLAFRSAEQGGAQVHTTYSAESTLGVLEMNGVAAQ